MRSCAALLAVVVGACAAAAVRSQGPEPRSPIAVVVAAAPSAEAIGAMLRADGLRLLAFPLTALLLVLIFRSLIAAAVPLILGALGIVLALSLLRIIASTTSISRHTSR